FFGGAVIVGCFVVPADLCRNVSASKADGARGYNRGTGFWWSYATNFESVFSAAGAAQTQASVVAHAYFRFRRPYLCRHPVCRARARLWARRRHAESALA